VSSDARQQWDLPVSSFQSSDFNLNPVTSLAGNVQAIRQGQPGRLTLRHATDIGSRCLEVSDGTGVGISGHLVEARLCHDQKIRQIAQAAWAIYTPTNQVRNTKIESWVECGGDGCNCGDDCELRISGHTESVSMETQLEGPCTSALLAKAYLPDFVNGTAQCFCQQDGREHKTPTLEADPDDLPVFKNVTKTTSK
jgi:hypothetical protein